MSSASVHPIAPMVDPLALREHEAASLFPIMPEASLRDLANNIQTYGLRNAVVLFRQANGDHVVLDGRNRILACRMIGETPRYCVWDGADPVAYVISENLHRRHLDESQRAMVAARLATLQRGGDRRSKAPIEALKQQDAVNMLNASRTSVQRARVVLNSGSEELARAVDDGHVAVSVAASIAQLPQDQRLEALSKAKEPRRAPAKSRRNFEHDRKLAEVELRHGQGLGTEDIARVTGISPSNVSTIKKKLGVSGNAPTIRLWKDVEHAVAVLEGAEVRVRQLADALSDTELNANEEEIRRCTKRLSSITGAIRALSSALRSHLP